MPEERRTGVAFSLVIFLLAKQETVTRSPRASGSFALSGERKLRSQAQTKNFDQKFTNSIQLARIETEQRATAPRHSVAIQPNTITMASRLTGRLLNSGVVS